MHCHLLAAYNRMIDQPPLNGDFAPGVHGMTSGSYYNPLGKVSIKRCSPQDLERASVVMLVR